MDDWLWDFGVIYATAIETAKSGNSAYNHTKHRTFTTVSSLNQEKSMGFELDAGFNYLWNNEIKVGASMGYVMPGEYYAFAYIDMNNNQKHDPNEPKKKFKKKIRALKESRRTLSFKF